MVRSVIILYIGKNHMNYKAGQVRVGRLPKVNIMEVGLIAINQ